MREEIDSQTTNRKRLNLKKRTQSKSTNLQSQGFYFIFHISTYLGWAIALLNKLLSLKISNSVEIFQNQKLIFLDLQYLMEYKSILYLKKMLKESQSKKILIIGAGFSGLAAIRHAKQAGFLPTALEKKSQIGGIWHPEMGYAWKDLTINSSKYVSGFKGFPFPKQADAFPTSKQFFAYMQSFAEKFSLYPFIRFNSEVISIKKMDIDKKVCYEAIWNENGVEKTQIFPFVIIASGIASHPFMPKLKGTEDFKGKIIHASEYKSGKQYIGKKVATIGGSVTGVELSGNISQYCQKTIHCYRTRQWILSHFLAINEATKVPADFIFQSRMYHSAPKMSFEEQIEFVNKFFSSICPQQQKSEKLRIDQKDFKKMMNISLSSIYVGNVEKNKIIPRLYQSLELTENTIKFEDGSEEQIDAVILCTGYRDSVSYLDKEIKKQIQYDQQYSRLPLVLYKAFAHPNLPNLMFVGMWTGVNFGACDIQAQIAIKIFSGQITIDKQVMLKGVEDQRMIRSMVPQPQLAHLPFIKYLDEIAKDLGTNFKIDELKQKDPELYHRFVMLPPIFQERFYFTTQNARQQVDYWMQYMKSASIKI